VIAPWIYAVSRSQHGADALRVLFWHNIIGRFTKIGAPPTLDYTTGHQNSPGKYLLELPVYLLPWTLLGAAALGRAWNRVRDSSKQATAWRFGVCAIVPFLVLLSLAATARDIYAAPVLLGFAILIGLWCSEITVGHLAQRATRFDRIAIFGTRALVTLIAAVFVLVLAVLTVASGDFTYVSGAAAIAALAIIGLRFAAALQRHNDLFRSLAWTYTAYATTLTLGGLAVFPTIDRGQDLPSVAQQVREDARGGPLALWDPDETTVAILDHRAHIPFVVLTPDSGSPEKALSRWFAANGSGAHVLMKLPGSGPSDVSRLLARLHPMAPADDGVVTTLANEGVVAVAHRYELPEGRRYALLSAPAKHF
jgi:hypothetical protein